MDRKLSRKEFEEIAVITRKCIDAYSSKEVANDLKRLNFLSSTLNVDPYIRGVISELHGYAFEASKQKPHDVKDHWVKQAMWTLGKLELSHVEC